ncbi:hypothetical protein [Oceanobacillus senegalensis]|uniref:hypothetical protein n=1 Tax=Oceanobacillus senegalensis TaxID=1936063 RepID=UPI000A3069DF|nr:hypothetical protein [Oceanobacillus senegalensis]
MNKIKIIFSLAQLILPWLTLPRLGKRTFYRFLPVSSFICLFLGALSVIANKRKWWINKNPLFPGPVDLSYLLGTYFIGTMWIFKFNYGNFSRYVLINIALDWINAYPFFYISKLLGIFKLQKMRSRSWFYMSVLLAIIIYAIQNQVEKSIFGTKERGMGT